MDEAAACELLFFDCTASEIVGIVSHDLLCSAPGVDAWHPPADADETAVAPARLNAGLRGW